MDPELIAYLDERFRGIDERFRGIDERFRGIDESFSQQIQGLREETSQRFDKVDKRLEQLDEQLRLTDVKVEALRDNIKQVAEGVAAGNEKVDSFKVEVAREFSDTKALIQDGYSDLDKRVKVLERRARIS
jgi:chromosome segregation ATPase